MVSLCTPMLSNNCTCLISVICVFLRIVVSKTYCVVYLMWTVSLDCPFLLPLRYSLTFI